MSLGGNAGDDDLDSWSALGGPRFRVGDSDWAEQDFGELRKDDSTSVGALADDAGDLRNEGVDAALVAAHGDHRGSGIDEGAREAGKDPAGKPKILQNHLSWHPDPDVAMDNALLEWPNGGMAFPKQDIKSPLDFEQMAKLVRPEDFEGRMLISSDPEKHRVQIQRFLDLGFDQVYLHNVGRNQKEWIEVFGRDVLPKLTA